VRQIPFFHQKSKSIFFNLYFCNFFTDYYILLELSLIQSFFSTNFRCRELCMSPSMTKIHGFFCNVRQIFCSLYIFLIKKYFLVISSVFDKTQQKQKSKNINRTLQHLETSEVWFECRESRKNVTCVSLFYPI
jgi:hypothetical protein